MSIQKLHILFYPFRTKLNKKGLCPLKCRITYNRNRKEFSTGVFINPDFWLSKKQATSNDQLINHQIESIYTEIKTSFLKVSVQNKKLSVFHIFQEFKGDKSVDEIGTSEFYQTYLTKLEKLVGIEIKQSTWNKFYYLGNHINDFIAWKYSVNDVPLNDLEFKFLEDFDYYLKTEKGHKQITINKIIQKFRRVIKVALAEKCINHNPFILYKAKRIKHTITYLTWDELDSLRSHYFESDRLTRTRDCFVFCCFTGLAYLEMSSLKHEHIVVSFDGNLWIQMDRAKTGKKIAVPLLPMALHIIDKYRELNQDHVLPRLSNQKFNYNLKVIAQKIDSSCSKKDFCYFCIAI